MGAESPSDAPPLAFRIVNWIGIINQLATTAAAQRLRALDLPLPQFTLLNHFSHRPAEAKRVTDIARAMQQPQPGISKTVQKLIDRGLLRVRADPGDGREKWLLLTGKGIGLHRSAIASLMPAVEQVFAGWDEAEMAALLRQLDRLKIFLDDNR